MENPDKRNEHELPVGNDHGYLWLLDNYWRIQEKDGGTYVQVESVGLSRSIPAIFAWLINPLVRDIPRTDLSNLLNATRRAARELRRCREPDSTSWAFFEHPSGSSLGIEARRLGQVQEALMVFRGCQRCC